MNLETLLRARTPIGLSDIDSVALMDRFDEKFMVPNAWLPDVLQDLATHQILTIQGEVTTRYNNLYFDTDENACLEAHTRGRSQRMKIRIRHYANTDVAFLEVKVRDVHGKTAKHRQIRDHGSAWDAPLTERERDFRASLVPFSFDLKPVLQSRFERFTLAELHEGERVTFDQHLEFCQPGSRDWVRPAAHVAIVEWKQGIVNHQGTLIQAFRRQPTRRGPLGRSLRLSKYILGRHSMQPSLPLRTYKAALRDVHRAELLAANPTFAPERLLQ